MQKQKTIKKRILGAFFLIVLSGGIFILSFFLESRYSVTEAIKRKNQVILTMSDKTEQVLVEENGNEVQFAFGSIIKPGNIIKTQTLDDVTLKFSEYGELRLAAKTKVLLIKQGEGEQSEFIFKVLEGRVWLNNLLNDSRVNIVGDGVVIVPNHSIVYFSSEQSKSLAYAYSNTAELYLVPLNYEPKDFIGPRNAEIINRLILAEGTQAVLYQDKILNNTNSLKKLLYSKLVKELQYGVFDRSIFGMDEWLKKNLGFDQLLASQVQNQTLANLQSRGLKYTSFSSLDYSLDQVLKDFYNALTISTERTKSRVIGELLNHLHDSEYLYNVGRIDEAKERLSYFSGQSINFFNLYELEFKEEFLKNLQGEYEQLAFVHTDDVLFEVKSVIFDILQKYSVMDSQLEGLEQQFQFLKEYMNNLYYLAGKGDANNFKLFFDQYINKLKILVEKNSQLLSQNLYLLEEQIQLFDNLFKEFPILYRDTFFASRIFIENQYLSILPESQDKNEAKQSIVSQRIDFLRSLQEFFLDGQVSLAETIKIVFRLNREIDNIVLPDDLQVAVADLFKARLKDFAVFYRFLNSSEYLNSISRGKTLRERFLRFVQDQTTTINIEDVRAEIKKQSDVLGNNNSGSSLINIPANIPSIQSGSPGSENQNPNSSDSLTGSQNNADSNNNFTQDPYDDSATISKPVKRVKR